MNAIPTAFDPIGTLGYTTLPAGFEVASHVHVNLATLPAEGFLLPIKPFSSSGWQLDMQVGGIAVPRAAPIIRVGPPSGVWLGRVSMRQAGWDGGGIENRASLPGQTAITGYGSIGATNRTALIYKERENYIGYFRGVQNYATVRNIDGGFFTWTSSEVAGQSDSFCGIDHNDGGGEFDFYSLHFASDTNGVIDLYPVRHADGREGLWAPCANKFLQL